MKSIHFVLSYFDRNTSTQQNPSLWRPQVCDSLTRSGAALCGSCRGQPQLAVAVLHARAAALHAALSRLVQVLYMI